jgi:NAD(P)-dependent dehydrogenase (short-subunit alcohol dehydrogenase family)
MLITGVSSGLGKALAERGLHQGLAGGGDAPERSGPSEFRSD